MAKFTTPIDNHQIWVDEGGKPKRGRVETTWYAFFVYIRNWINENSQSGTTALRPTTNLYTGREYFDTDLNQKICIGADGATWVSTSGVNDNNSTYRMIHKAMGLIMAGSTADTWDIPFTTSAVAMSNAGNGVGGVHTSNNTNVFYLAAADYPTVGALTTKLRVRVSLLVNDVAPTGNFTIGLYPITRPGTSGGIGQQIITLGTVVSGSTVLFATPAADAMSHGDSGDFAIPADGDYVLGLVTTATVAVNSRVDINATLQMRNT